MTVDVGPAARDVVVVTSEDDAVDDLSIRMGHARRMHDVLKDVDPKTLLVHPDDNGTFLLVRTAGARHAIRIGTTLARRFDASLLTDEMLERMLEVVVVALDRYGTVDPRQDEHDRRCRAVMDCVLHDHASSEPDQTVQQVQFASPCPWSPACADVGASSDDDWHESYRDLPEAAGDHVARSVEISIDGNGRIQISAMVAVWLLEDVMDRESVDAMGRLRLQSEILNGHPFPSRG